jgi:hypothetical protein
MQQADFKNLEEGKTTKQFLKTFGQNIEKRYQKSLGHPSMLGTHLYVEHP